MQYQATISIITIDGLLTFLNRRRIRTFGTHVYGNKYCGVDVSDHDVEHEEALMAACSSVESNRRRSARNIRSLPSQIS